MLEIKAILEEHAKWLLNEGGSRADLSEANLSEASLYGANLFRANLSRADLYGATLPQTLTVEEWCNAHELALLPNGHRVAFKRLHKDMITGNNHNQPVKWTRGRYVEAKDWNTNTECGGGLHLSSSPRDTRRYSEGTICVPVSFAIEDAVHLGDKLKVRRCKVL